ncbi:ATP-binding protein [Kitasatospora sp. NPDC004240]
MDAIVGLPAGALGGIADRTAWSASVLSARPCAVGAPPGRGAGVWELARHPASVGVARCPTRAMLRVWGVGEEAIDQALLVVCGLVANAVEHALASIALHLERPVGGEALRIEVDGGGPAAGDGAPGVGRAPDECGRGRAIIARLAAAHGSRPGGWGATCWADL